MAGKYCGDIVAKHYYCTHHHRSSHHLLFSSLTPHHTMAAVATTATRTTETERKSIFDLVFFSRNPKRANPSIIAESSVKKIMPNNSSINEVVVGGGGGANVKKSKPLSLDKSRKKEVKQRLNAEASKEIRPLAVGTMAMMVSALSNQGR